jgi:hypothetical protein
VEALHRETEMLSRLLRRALKEKTSVPRYNAIVKVQRGDIQAVEEE